MNPIAQRLPGLLGGQTQQPTGVGNVMGLNAAQLQRLYPMWQQQSIQAQTDGMPFPQFNEWVQTQGQQMMGNME